jgi:hypothetical protein
LLQSYHLTFFIRNITTLSLSLLEVQSRTAGVTVASDREDEEREESDSTDMEESKVSSDGRHAEGYGIFSDYFGSLL